MLDDVVGNQAGRLQGGDSWNTRETREGRMRFQKAVRADKPLRLAFVDLLNDRQRASVQAATSTLVSRKSFICCGASLFPL